jgi:hypothetical protein
MLNFVYTFILAVKPWSVPFQVVVDLCRGQKIWSRRRNKFFTGVSPWPITTDLLEPPQEDVQPDTKTGTTLPRGLPAQEGDRTYPLCYHGAAPTSPLSSSSTIPDIALHRTMGIMWAWFCGGLVLGEWSLPFIHLPCTDSSGDTTCLQLMYWLYTHISPK